MSKDTAYFDYAATTPLDPSVLEAMLPFLQDDFGNPSSIHVAGQRAETAVEQARALVASLINTTPSDITFTSGATESNNLALRGVAFSQERKRGARRILTTEVEHPSVIQTCRALAEYWGFILEFIPIDHSGRVEVDQLESMLDDDIAFVSAVYANNEIGTVNPIAEIGRLCQERSILFHTDAAQAANHLLIDVDSLCVDFMTLGAHKFYGPKGVGVLYHRNMEDLFAIQTGGSQEYGTRAGTHNVPSIVGFARALEIAREHESTLSPRLEALRDELIETIERKIPDARLTGDRKHRLHNHASFAFRNIDSNQLLAALDMAGYACSSGSACKTGQPEPSNILLALGFEPELALGALRITLGRGTTDESVQALLKALPQVIQDLRKEHIISG